MLHSKTYHVVKLGAIAALICLGIYLGKHLINYINNVVTQRSAIMESANLN